MSKNTVERSFLKTITYRIIGTIATALTGFAVTGNLIYGLKIGTIDVFLKMIIYFAHERTWQNIEYGKRGD